MAKMRKFSKRFFRLTVATTVVGLLVIAVMASLPVLAAYLR